MSKIQSIYDSMCEGRALIEAKMKETKSAYDIVEIAIFEDSDEAEPHGRFWIKRSSDSRSDMVGGSIHTAEDVQGAINEAYAKIKENDPLAQIAELERQLAEAKARLAQ